MSAVIPESGILHLDSLYEFVTEHQQAGDDALRLKGSEHGPKYSQLCRRISDDVANVAGFYIWGRYDSKRYWRSIYVGKAGYKQDGTNLRKRILEELKDERGFVWCYIHGKAKTQEICLRIHNGKYSWKKAILKAGATEIIWIRASELSGTEILKVEADLIEAVNPSANLIRPTPVRSRRDETERIFLEFREIIHKHRPLKASPLHRSVDAALSRDLKTATS